MRSFTAIGAGYVAVLVLATASAAQPADTSAAPDAAARDQARELFEQGVALMVNENWEVALAQLTRSFEIYPTRSALFNIGMCEKALHRYLNALHHFESWRERFEADAPANDRAAVSGAIEDLQQFLGTITFASDPPGATFRLDGEEVDPGMLAAPLLTDAARHTVEATLDGYVTATQSVLVTPRENVAVSLTLQPETVAVTAPDVPPPVVGATGPDTEPTVEEPEGLDQAWFWTTAAVAVAMGIGGAAAGGITLSTEDDLDGLADRCEAGDRGACDDGRAMVSDYDDAQLATNVLLFGAGAFAISALVLAFFTEFDFGEEAPEVTVTPTDGGAAIGFRTAF